MLLDPSLQSIKLLKSQIIYDYPVLLDELPLTVAIILNSEDNSEIFCLPEFFINRKKLDNLDALLRFKFLLGLN
jgi:hypothetical protein